MRIRSILPKFYDSTDVGEMDWDTRLVFIGLWSYCDDNGVGRDVDALIAADLFPYDLSRHPRDTLARLSRGLQQLSDGCQITRYTVAGQPYLFINGWDAYQRIDRPAKPRYPRPTTEDAVIRDTLATPSRHPRETVATGEGEKGRRGEVSTSPADAADGAFDEWWQAYPRKVGKGQARKAYTTALRKASDTVLLDAAREFAKRTKDADPKFIPHPATWLNGERWTDQPDVKKPARIPGATEWETPNTGWEDWS